MLFTSYSITIITYDKTQILLSESQLVLVTSALKSIQTMSTTFSSETLNIQILQKTKQKDLVLYVQNIFCTVQLSLENMISTSTATANESESSSILDTISNYKSALSSLGNDMIFFSFL